MAQVEDTELRDLVVEALEKNGSLAKIRALLRANIFLAFEDEREKPRQNESLDKILNLPEGKLSLCIIHEFLEFCNLKNTLFVYMSETRQGKEYTYRKDDMLDKLNVPKLDRDKEPALLTIVKNAIKLYSSKRFSNSNEKQRTKGDIKDEQNCTYIVHEDTSSSSQSQSDNSSDEKNKINLRLPLDNSDTDTSSDSARDKNSSEYMPNSQNLMINTENDVNKTNNIMQTVQRVTMENIFGGSANKVIDNFQDIKNFNSSSDSTSYMELRPLHSLNEALLTAGLPITDNNVVKNNTSSAHSYSGGSKSESASSVHTLTNSNRSNKKDLRNESPQKIKQSADDSGLNDTETMEYSYDFSPPNTEHKSSSDNKLKKLSESIILGNNSSVVLNNSLSSPSSISTSEVAELISEKSYRSFSKDNKNDSNTSHRSRLSNNSKRNISLKKEHSKINSDNSSDFSESSVPSLSNFSLEIHSE